MTSVCFSVDDFLFEADLPMFMAELSDGTTVYQDDNRPGLEPNAWHRLRSYLYEKKLNITRLLVKFRSHVEVIGSSEYGYFFRRGVLGIYGSTTSVQRFVCGLLQADDTFNVFVYNTPEMILDEIDGRSTRPNVGHEDCLILNFR